MNHSVFLSYPNPFTKDQERFIIEIKNYLKYRSFEPRTLGVTDYDTDEPLVAIRRLMLESNGLITVAFRRSIIIEGAYKPKTKDEKVISEKWLTSPYCHIEPAMAFQIGLPILILREKGVIQNGILEKGVTGTYLPEFDLDVNTNDYLESAEWNQLIGKWEGYVRKVIEEKGKPPKLY